MTIEAEGKKPEITNDSVSDALGAADRQFDGKPTSDEAGADALLSGHPAEDASLTPDEETPGQGEGAGGKPKETPPGEKPGEEEPKFTPRFKDQEEAEGKLTEQEQAVGRLATDLEETKSLLLRALANQSGQPAGQPASETIPPEKDFVKTRRREAMSDVEALDPDEEDYKDKVADAQAKADKDIQDHYHKQLKAEVAAEQTDGDSKAAVQVQISEAMKEAGLDPVTDSPDSGMFSHYSNRFQVVGTQLIDTTTKLPVSTQDAINKTVGMVKTYKLNALEEYKVTEAQRKAEEKQDGDQPLGRGSAVPGGSPGQSGDPKDDSEKKWDKPMSLRAVVGNVEAARVI